MNFKETTVNKNYVFNGRILNVRADDVKVLNGRLAKREIVEHNGGSCIVCEKDGKILLVKQFRYAVDDFLYELPAGKREGCEDPAVTAARELEEECGLKAEEISLMFKVYPSPGYTNEIINVFYVNKFSQSETNFDEDECIESVWFTKAEILEMIKKGEITDAKTLIGVLAILNK